MHVLQVKAVLTTTAVISKIKDAKTAANLLLQTDLDIVPTVTFQPEALPQAVLYSNTPAANMLQQLSLVSSLNFSISYQV